jgi:hypothetical protein
MDGPLWEEAREALAGVAELSRLKGGEGIDIHFINNTQYRLDLRVCCSSPFTFKNVQTYP